MCFSRAACSAAVSAACSAAYASAACSAANTFNLKTILAEAKQRTKTMIN